VLPRYHFVSTLRRTPQEEEALDILKGRDFDPWSEAVVLSEQAETVSVAPGEILSLDRRSQSLRLTVQCPGDGFLVLGDAYYPSCRATVDNHPTPLYRTNHAFRGLQVPAGRHDILVTYSTAGILSILPLSGLCLLGMALLTWRLRSPTGLQPRG
jgi:uncharacterized membrane protein YfhO